MIVLGGTRDSYLVRAENNIRAGLEGGCEEAGSPYPHPHPSLFPYPPDAALQNAAELAYSCLVAFVIVCVQIYTSYFEVYICETATKRMAGRVDPRLLNLQCGRLAGSDTCTCDDGYSA
ncbi:unnamed protein product [Pylaiella littoralis]